MNYFFILKAKVLPFRHVSSVEEIVEGFTSCHSFAWSIPIRKTVFLFNRNADDFVTVIMREFIKILGL